MIFYFIIFNVFVLMVSSSSNDQHKFFTTSLHFQLCYPTFVFDNIYLGILQYFKVVDNYFSNKNNWGLLPPHLILFVCRKTFHDKGTCLIHQCKNKPYLV